MNKPQFIRILTVFTVIAAVLLTSCSSVGNISLTVSPNLTLTGANSVQKPVAISEEIHGIWIASVYNIDFPSAPDLTAEKLKAELDTIVSNVLSYNMNTIYFQVHPASDALYRSDIFPVSEFLFTDGILHFDPLEYMADICKENDISLYAWINPLRVSVSSSSSDDEARELLPEGSPGKDEGSTVFYGDGKLYLNCGVESVRNLVSDAVREIVTSYDVDGIVFDDYFYPYPVASPDGSTYVFDDSETYKNANTALPLADWRRNNVNEMIKQCYSQIKSCDPELEFGIAPFGIWQNDNGTNGGSATSGMEAYHELYCDAEAWIKGKYIDFISPQLYWTLDSATAPFGELLSFWNIMTEGTGVDLIISHSAYQYESWEDPEGELQKQIELSRDKLSYKGSILYGYSALQNNIEGVTDETKSVFKDEVYYYHPSNFPEDITMSASSNVTIDKNSVIFDGYSNPDKPLSVNGISVPRSHGGYFQCELMLESGENEFVFTCGDTVKTVTVINNISDKTE